MLRSRPRIAFVTVFAVLAAMPSSSPAAEIDSFAPRSLPVAEGLPAIDAEVEARINRALERANSVSSCSSLTLQLLLGSELLRPFYGRLEEFANTSPLVPRITIEFSRSIYQDAPNPNYGLLLLSEVIFGFGNVIRAGSTWIGTDKLGHFFDEGHYLYLRLNSDGSNLEEVLAASENTEIGLNGLALGGVKSFADLVANYQGMLFWNSALEHKLETDRPFFRCEGGTRWISIRRFRFEDFVDPAWDEAYNCNEYVSAELESAVRGAIARLRDSSGKSMRCPISDDVCPVILAKYQRHAARILNPSICRDAHRP